MKFLITSASVLLLIAETANSEDRIIKRIFNRYEGKEYELLVKDSHLKSAPKWGEQEENPPLSARAAAKLARQYIDRVVPKSGIDQLHTISLERMSPQDHGWIYIVSFWADPPDRRAIQIGPLNTFKVIVLLNGFTPQAKARDLPQQSNAE